MKIAIASDHRGHEAAAHLAGKLQSEGHAVQQFGAKSTQPTDYPEVAFDVGVAVSAGGADLGICICGTGIGMSIAANKVRGVRAAVVADELTAELSRSHNDANVLCLSADLLGQQKIDQIVDKFLATPFEGGRHARRVRKIEAIERGESPAGVKD